MEASQEGGHSDLVIRLFYLKDLLIKMSEVAPHTLIFVLLYAKQVSDRLLVAAPSIKCNTKDLLNSAKEAMEAGASLASHCQADLFKVVGNALHMISLGTLCSCIRVL